MERIEMNVITGEQKVIPLTPEEIAEIESRLQPTPQSSIDLTAPSE
jgi:hypothetical protein